MATNSKTESFEKTLFKTADKLRKNMDAADKILEGKGDFAGANAEDPDEYRAENVFFVPPTARWSYLHSRAKLPTIGKDIDVAMEEIEKVNPTLKGILPKVFARPNLDKTSLGGLIDLIGNIALGTEAAKSKDLLGRVYEYFLGEFANAEGKKGGQFYTPKSIVKLMVEMIEPYKGRVYDPACGSGGMFIMSEKFIEEHKGKVDDISIYGQESNQTTYRLCRMNLAIRGIDGSQVKWNTEGSFLNDLHKDLKADFVLANPPFNDSDWSGELLQNDARWNYGLPPASNANFAWLQHMIYHLSPKGVMACVLANGSLSSQSNMIDVDKHIPFGWEVTSLDKIADIVMGQSPVGDSYNLTNDGLPFYQGITDFGDKYQNEKAFLNNTTGTVFDSISGAELRNFELMIPKDPTEQMQISSILTSIDDKLELLKEQNNTLEEILQTLFSEWFVNFKFPEAHRNMIESDIGEIPEDWSVGKFFQVVEIKGGTTPSTKNPEFWNGNIAWTSPKDLSNSKEIYLLDTAKKITDKGLNEIGTGLLPEGTLLLSSRAPIGYMSITDIEVSINQGYIAFLPGQYVFQILHNL
ncbi:unnamed protein product [Rotaria sp. Silwood1]|nr:unnamed protein product [Rotaria sp. Silwood1]